MMYNETHVDTIPLKVHDHADDESPEFMFHDFHQPTDDQMSKPSNLLAELLTTSPFYFCGHRELEGDALRCILLFPALERPCSIAAYGQS